MHKRIAIPALMAALLSFALGGCYYDNKEDLYQNYSQTSCDATGSTFSNDVQPIITNNCAVAGCHSGPNPQNGIDLSNFQDLQTIADDGRLVGRITGSTGSVMPPGSPLDNCSIEKIRSWVQNGAPQN